ncbi:glutamyl-tRNA reductase [Bernardetia sp.]|uniref:glutamyl-tRNA reductase n=1 Tax=Bernardetia sp. TaxID=1937974 RepID=UPI0025BF672E|nr:glutamyl-tRNA reductase [Bernardetia sp.]
MENSFGTFYITYKEASVPTRERFSLSERETETLLLELKAITEIQEVFILSTCNRTEVYWYGKENAISIVKEKFAQIKSVSIERLIKAGFRELTHSDEVIKRFFEISVGVDSQIIGDWQITHQVKQAYQLADELETIGTYFHKLISFVLKASKKITSQTVFRSGAASVSFATADLVRKIVKNNPSSMPSILVVGVGKIGADTVRNLRKMGIQNVKITNRTLGKSAMLATENAYEVIDFKDVFEEAEKADIVISSVSLPNFFNSLTINVRNVSCRQCFIDLSMPRSVEHKLTNFLKVYNIDDLKEQTKAVREERIGALSAVYEILKEERENFQNWKTEYEYILMLHPFKTALEDLKNNISNKYSSELDEKNQQLITKILTDFTQKAMRIPIVNLKTQLNNHPNQEHQKPFLDTLQRLFS